MVSDAGDRERLTVHTNFCGAVKSVETFGKRTYLQLAVYSERLDDLTDNNKFTGLIHRFSSSTISGLSRPPGYYLL
jgi:hypothetical protein